MPTLNGDDISVKISSEADTAGFKEAEKRLAGFSEKTVKASKLVAKSMLAIGAAVGVGLGIAVKKAAQFETRMTDVSTLIGGDSTDAIKRLSDGILEMTRNVPKDADELGASSYAIMSAGFTESSEALDVLNNSARLAVAGLGSTEEATNLMTVAMNAFDIPAEDAANAADVLFKTVKNGITDVPRLAQAFGKMAGNAAAAGVTFEDVQASTAALSAVTGKTAEAQNALAQVYIELTQAGGKLDKGLESNGGSLERLNELIGKKGTVGGFAAMRDELDLSDTQFKNLFSSAEGGTAVFSLLTSANEGYTTSLEDMQKGTNAIDEAFEKQSRTFANSLQILKNSADEIAITVGSKLLPPLADFARFLSENIRPALESVVKFLSENEEAMIILASVLVALVTPAFIAWGSAAIGAAVGTLAALAPLVAAGLVLAGVALIIKDLWEENFLGIQDIVNRIITFLVDEVFPKVLPAMEKVIGKFQDLAKWVKENKKEIEIAAGVITTLMIPALVRIALHGTFAALGLIATKTAALALGAGRVIGALTLFTVHSWRAAAPWIAFAAAVAAILVAMDQLLKLLERTGLIATSKEGGVVGQLKALGQLVSGNIKAGAIGNIFEGNFFGDGGIVPGPINKPQLAVVHGGEEVIPVGGGGGREIVVNQTNFINNDTDMEAAMRELGWRLSV